MNPAEVHFAEAETHALRQEVRRLDLMNQALIDAGKSVVTERDELRANNEQLLEALQHIVFVAPFNSDAYKIAREAITK